MRLVEKLKKDCLVSQRSGSLSTYTTACMLVGIEAVCGVDQFLLQVTDLVEQFLLQLSNIDCSPHIYMPSCLLSLNMTCVGRVKLRTVHSNRRPPLNLGNLR